MSVSRDKTNRLFKTVSYWKILLSKKIIARPQRKVNKWREASSTIQMNMVNQLATRLELFIMASLTRMIVAFSALKGETIKFKKQWTWLKKSGNKIMRTIKWMLFAFKNCQSLMMRKPSLRPSTRRVRKISMIWRVRLKISNRDLIRICNLNLFVFEYSVY